MARLKLLLPGGKSFSLSSPFSKQTKKFAGLSLIINIASLIWVGLFSFLLPLSGNLFSIDSETSVLKFLILFVIGFLVIFLIKVLIQGTATVMDPKGLLMILVFNLVLTILSITITTLRVSNTFGTTGFRYLSGLALMSLIGLFYFVNLYASNKLSVYRFLNFFSAGAIAYVTWYLLANNQTPFQIVANLPVLIIALGSLTYSVLKDSSKLAGTLVLFIFTLLIIASTPFNVLTYSSLLYLGTVGFIAYSMVLALYVLKTKDTKSRFFRIKKQISEFIAAKKLRITTNQGFADLHWVIIFVIPVILVLSTFALYLAIPQNIKNVLGTEILNHYNDGVRLLTGGTYTINGDNLRRVVAGIGSDNFSTARPFIVNIFMISGLVGLFIYLFIWLYFIKAAKNLFVRSLKDGNDFKLQGLILFSVLFIPFTFFISHGNLLSVILLWVMYGFISAKQSNFNIDYLDNKNLVIKGTKVSMVITIVAGIMTIVAAIGVLNLLFAVLR